jgi:hypothetical protein
VWVSHRDVVLQETLGEISSERIAAVFNLGTSQLKWKTSAAMLLSVFLVAGCHQKPNPDSIKLDGVLSGTGTVIDRVDLVSTVFNSSGLTFRTNTLTGTELTKFVVLLMKTNRIDSPDASKDQIELTAHLMHGTNALCSLGLFENGLWRFADYSFRTRSVP